MRRSALAVAAAAALLPLITGPSGRAAADTDPIVSIAGDIACGTTIAAYNGGSGTATQCRQKYTAALLPGSSQVWTLGDHAYPTATLTQLNAAYEPTWGQFKSITYPAPGDHDYGKIGGRDYFTYFGKPAYYSFDYAGWHVISLNSEIDHSATSAQVAWLQSDLASTPATCIAAFWGEPRWTSSSKAPGNATFDPFWQALYAAKADLALSGDSHNYERFTKMDPAGSPVADGIREFVVGTGGRSLVGFPSVQPNSQARVKAFGVLQLTLHLGSYDWRFVDELRNVRDSGSESCNA